ncbi:hypothetical protein BD311DRAFT_624894, partial [Dichomitus squalens]
ARNTPFHTYAGYQHSCPCQVAQSKHTPVAWPSSMHPIYCIYATKRDPYLKEDGLNDRTLTENTSADGPGIDV